MAGSRRKGAHRVVNTQRGSILVEFSLIAVSLSLLIALVVDVARMVFITQVLQETARVAARELALLPLSPAMTFEEALQAPEVKKRIFDPAALVIDVEDFRDSRDLENIMDGLPIVNRMLRPLMTFEEIQVNGRPREVLRFPGTLWKNEHDLGAGITSIGTPFIGIQGGVDGHDIWWKAILEEIRNDPDDPQSGAFSLLTHHLNQPSGLVALRVNYPFQPLFMNWLPTNAMKISGKSRNGDESIPESQGSMAVEVPMPDELIQGEQISNLVSLSNDAFKNYSRILFGQSVHRREIFQ